MKNRSKKSKNKRGSGTALWDELENEFGKEGLNDWDNTTGKCLGHILSRGIMCQQANNLFDRLNTPGLTSKQTSIVIEQLLLLTGTDIELNRRDAYGDGDQSLIGGREGKDEKRCQIIRELWGQGGDIMRHLVESCTEFERACAFGNITVVKAIIENTPMRKRSVLLEKRVTGLRLPPLMLTMALAKNKTFLSLTMGVREKSMNHKGVFSLLLFHGARPDCLDVTGKTICHYGAGIMATKETLTMTDYAIESAKSCSHFGEDIILLNLTRPEYNGLKGTLGSFITSSGRRHVLLSDGKSLSIKPINIFTLNETCIYDDSIKLMDRQDRIGSVCLHELVHSDRADVVEFILQKYSPSIDIEDSTGYSIIDAAYKNVHGEYTKTHGLLRKYSLQQTRKKCAFCRKDLQICLVCQRCQAASYCSKICQKAHWKDHRSQCKQSHVGIVIPKPPKGDRQNIGVPGYERRDDPGCYQKPQGVGVNEKFWVKIQTSYCFSRLLVYDKTRECIFHILPRNNGFKELLEKVKSQTAVSGKKCHFQAAFNASGECVVYSNTAKLKSW